MCVHGIVSPSLLSNSGRYMRITFGTILDQVSILLRICLCVTLLSGLPNIV